MPIALTRREFLAGTAAVCAAVRGFAAPKTAGLPVFPQVDTSKPLAEHAAAKGILFGSAMQGGAVKNPAYADLVSSQCRIGAPESELKWRALRPTPDKYDFSAGDSCYQFLSSHGMKCCGHALVW